MITKLASRTSIAACLVSAFFIANPVAADTAKTITLVKNEAAETPPLSFKGSRWTATNGCAYSRAGRPGETVWYLIINTSGGKDCTRVIPQSVYKDGAYASVKS